MESFGPNPLRGEYLIHLRTFIAVSPFIRIYLDPASIHPRPRFRFQDTFRDSGVCAPEWMVSWTQ